MYPITNYEMTEEDLQILLESCKPTPVMLIGGSFGGSRQENANNAWKALGLKMGFNHMTVHPIPGKGARFFSAVPSETDSQITERIAREKIEKIALEMVELKAQQRTKEREIQSIIARIEALTKG